MKRELAALILFIIFAVAIGIFAMHFASSPYATATLDVDETLSQETLNMYESLIENIDSEEFLANSALDINEALNEADNINEALIQPINDRTDYDEPYAVGWSKAMALYYGCACPREIMTHMGETL